MRLDTALIEKKELQPYSGATLIVSIDFNESYVTSVIAALILRWRWRLV